MYLGNVDLPLLAADKIENYLTSRLPLIDEILRKDGRPIDPVLPTHVTEPVDLGFGEGNTTIFDLRFAFHVVNSDCYKQKRSPVVHLYYQNLSTRLLQACHLKLTAGSLDYVSVCSTTSSSRFYLDLTRL